jgi:hypothetical protein
VQPPLCATCIQLLTGCESQPSRRVFHGRPEFARRVRHKRLTARPAPIRPTAPHPLWPRIGSSGGCQVVLLMRKCVPSATRAGEHPSGDSFGQPGTSSFFEAVSGRSHKETYAGCIVSLTTPTSSAFKASRSVSSRSLAEKASKVCLASYFLR